ncbi:YihY/virulence factor BrkB family protein [Actinospica sp. MGRD01-02]|uniref:YihY/virulence factor BrkB family protein n=1 Tax=Actinospica acidithermotolerans TaxID=2828514 RepID=A0A941EIB1_9ACTN|nr:YihY/virulence factor BrkB family protein [Actinospica acidithermotolerans]MBR7830943.1 YihY/virulence factor BrkB family protein [Actinospica acidithermotolerans]
MQTRIPRVLVERFRKISEHVERTRVYRAYHRYGVQRGARLAAAMTYTAFLSIFPALVLAIAIATVFLGDGGVKRVNDYIDKQLPGLAEKFSLNGVVANAATVGLISGVILLWSALSWVNTARGSMRMIWGVDDMPGNYWGRKALDLVSLVGLGTMFAVVIAASSLTTGFAETVLRWMNIEDSTPAKLGLQALGVVISLVAQTAMFAYLLSGIPRLYMPRWILLRTAFVAALVFEVTKGLVTSYVTRVAGKSLYGAFGVPIAILIWFNLTFQMLLALSAWTATRTEEELAKRSGAERPLTTVRTSD